MYAVFDDKGSIHSCATSEFSDMFNVKGEILSYMLHLWAGTVETTGIIASAG